MTAETYKQNKEDTPFEVSLWKKGKRNTHETIERIYKTAKLKVKQVFAGPGHYDDVARLVRIKYRIK